MGALSATIPGEGVQDHYWEWVPLTRIAQARSDLSPPELGLARVRHYKLAQVGYAQLGLGRGDERLRQLRRTKFRQRNDG